MNGRRNRIAAGFTLVEILVCVFIIATLAALVSNQLTTALNRSKTDACLSNLRQIGLAVQGYIGDNNDNLPSLTNRSLTSQNVPVMDTVLLPYTGSNTAVFHCPADTTNYLYSGDSYSWNYLPMLQPDGTYNMKYSALNFQLMGVSDYSQIILAIDKDSHPGYTTKLSNMLYADGHVYTSGT